MEPTRASGTGIERRSNPDEFIHSAQIRLAPPTRPIRETSCRPRARLLPAGSAGAAAARAACPGDWSEYLPPAYDQCDLAASAEPPCVTLAASSNAGPPGERSTPRRCSSTRCRDSCSSGRATAGRRSAPPSGDGPVRAPARGVLSLDPGRLEVLPGTAVLPLIATTMRRPASRWTRRGSTGSDTLAIVKAFLAAGFPCPSGYNCLQLADVRPRYPDAHHGRPAARRPGGRRRRLRRRPSIPSSCKGALHVRSSWGEGWGECGSGWLPYAYVEEQLAVDFWTLLRPEWLASGEFTRPRLGICHAIRGSRSNGARSDDPSENP